MTEHSFLDMVRILGRETQLRCSSECDPALHRREAAEFLLILRQHRDILLSLYLGAKR